MHRTRLSVGSVLALTVSAGIASAGPPLFSNTLGTPGFSGSYVASFAVHDDGSGEALYATGQFTATGAAGTTNLARWNGAAWEGVGGGLPLSRGAVGV